MDDCKGKISFLYFYESTNVVFSGIYRSSLSVINIVSGTNVYGDVRGDMVYYQLVRTTGRLNCYYRTKGTSMWGEFDEPSTYHGGYAECSGWTKGNPDYNIKLKLNGKEYVTDEQTAISIGPYRGKCNVYKT